MDLGTLEFDFARHFGERLVAIAAIREGERVLDVACGLGTSLFPASDAAGSEGHGVGIDSSPAVVARMRTEIAGGGNARVEILEMDAQALRFPDATFDAVLCGLAIYLFDDPRAALFEMRRVLKTSGRMVLSTTTWVETAAGQDLFGELLPSFIEKREDAEIERHVQSYADLLREAGFDDARISVESKEYTFPAKEHLWLWAWNHDSRDVLARLDAKSLRNLQTEAYRQVERDAGPDGICLVQRVAFVTGRK